MNFLIETKQEYTIHLVNSINSLVYDGLQNIYEEAKKNAKNNDELKKLKEAVINRKREEKFQLFSRSHFTNLENTININFQ